MCSRSLWSSAAAKNWLTLRLSPPPYGRHLSAKKNLRETEITEEVGYAVNACLGLIFRGNATPNTGAVACFSHLWWNRVNCDIYECRCTIFVGVSSILKQYIYIYTHNYIYIHRYDDMNICYDTLCYHCNDIVVLHRCPSTHYIRWPSLCREDSERHILILSHSKP